MNTFRTLKNGIALVCRINRFYFLLIFLNEMVTSISPFVTLYFSAKIINLVSEGADFPAVIKTVLNALAVQVVVTVLKEGMKAIREMTENNLRLGIDKAYSEINNSMSFVYLEKAQVKQLKNRIDSNNAASGAGIHGLNNGLSSLISSVLTVVVAVVMSFDVISSATNNDFNFFEYSVSLEMLIFFFVTFVCIGIAAWSGVVQYKKELNEWDKLPQTNRLFSYFRNSLKYNCCAMDIRVYSWKDRIEKEIRKITRDVGHLDNVSHIRNKYRMISATSYGVLMLCTYIFLTREIIKEHILLGDFVVLSETVRRLAFAFVGIVTSWGKLIANNPFVVDVLAYFNLNKEDDTFRTKAIRNANNLVVSVSKLTYFYPDSSIPALENMNYEFVSGKKYALVGENGSGKTTFIKVLCGLYQPTEGDVFINGESIGEVNRESLYSMFSVVFQDYSLFSLPLGQNIAGRKEYDSEKVEKALFESGMRELYSSLTDGLDTYLYKDFDTKGEMLSGGEAQKVAIARALYKDSPIMILDEPSSSLDSYSEEKLYTEINKSANDKLTIFTSHRLSSCMFCDEILVFDKGKIVQSGSHVELLKEKSGKYYELWNAQAKYYA